MSASGLDELRARADELDVGEEALALYSEILDLDPDDSAAANMIGRSLQELGRIDEAREHWAFIAELQPGNEIARSRARSLKPVQESVQVTTSRPTKPKRTPSEILEPALEGEGREGALRFLARSILLIEKIDPARLSVTERVSDARFRIYGGREPAVTPARGLLHVWVHEPAVSAELAAAIGEIDGAQRVGDGHARPAAGLARVPPAARRDGAARRPARRPAPRARAARRSPRARPRGGIRTTPSCATTSSSRPGLDKKATAA